MIPDWLATYQERVIDDYHDTDWDEARAAVEFGFERCWQAVQPLIDERRFLKERIDHLTALLNKGGVDGVRDPTGTEHGDAGPAGAHAAKAVHDGE